MHRITSQTDIPNGIRPDIRFHLPDRNLLLWISIFTTLFAIQKRRFLRIEMYVIVFTSYPISGLTGLPVSGQITRIFRCATLESYLNSLRLVVLKQLNRYYLPVKEILAHGSGGALGRRIPAQILQLLVDPLKRHSFWKRGHKLTNEGLEGVADLFPGYFLPRVKGELGQLYSFFLKL